MNQMETIHQHIEITRQQLICQLNEELANFQRECLRLSQCAESGTDIRRHRIYHRIIASKRRLIDSLSTSDISTEVLHA